MQQGEQVRHTEIGFYRTVKKAHEIQLDGGIKDKHAPNKRVLEK